MAETTGFEKYNDEVKVQKLLHVLAYQVELNAPLTEACDHTGLSATTFYRWVGEGLLTDALAEMREQRRTTLQAVAVGAMPRVLEYMIHIATGAKEVRGANPIAAARLIAQFAGVVEGSADREGAGVTFQFYPQQALFVVGNGRPQLDNQGRLQVIEGEFEEVEN